MSLWNTPAEITKASSKRPADWLRTDYAQRFIQEFLKVNNFTYTDLLQVAVKIIGLKREALAKNDYNYSNITVEVVGRRISLKLIDDG
jgi:hypothetical protein